MRVGSQLSNYSRDQQKNKSHNLQHMVHNFRFDSRNILLSTNSKLNHLISPRRMRKYLLTCRLIKLCILSKNHHLIGKIQFHICLLKFRHILLLVENNKNQRHLPIDRYSRSNYRPILHHNSSIPIYLRYSHVLHITPLWSNHIHTSMLDNPFRFPLYKRSILQCKASIKLSLWNHNRKNMGILKCSIYIPYYHHHFTTSSIQILQCTMW